MNPTQQTIKLCVDGITIEVSTENLSLTIENILNGVFGNVRLFI